MEELQLILKKLDEIQAEQKDTKTEMQEFKAEQKDMKAELQEF